MDTVAPFPAAPCAPPAPRACRYRVYSFGKTASGMSSEPVEVLRLTDPIVDVQAGNLYSLALTATGRVYAWGLGTYGRLGLGDDALRETPQLIPSLEEPIDAIVASNWFSLFVCRSTRTVLRCGRFGGESTLRPEPVLEFAGHAASAVAAGDSCLAAIVDGVVHVIAGGNSAAEELSPIFHSGALSRGRGSSHATVVLPSHAHGIFLRGRSFVATCADGRAYAWGVNTSSCLGVRSTHGVVWPPEMVLVPLPLVSASTSTGHTNVHTLFLDASGSVSAAGSNYKFKTGVPSRSTRKNNTHSCEAIAPPRAVPGLLGHAAVQVAAGALHSVAVTADGDVLLWGCGSDGRLGFPEFRSKHARYLYHEPVPRRAVLPRGQRATRAHTHWYHTLVVTAEE